MRLFLSPYQIYSESAKGLAGALGVKRVSGEKIFRPNDIIINWGKSVLSPRGNPRIINIPEAVAKSVNKIITFNILKTVGIDTVEHTTSREVAMQWIDEGATVYARTVTTGHSGQGIVILNYENAAWVDCSLYTKAILKAHEYRVHVFNGQVIDLQKKKRRDGSEASGLIKNLSNGWVFCREDVKAPLDIFTTAVAAVKALGLHFGAVDILYKATDNKVAVLEINSAPGLQGHTLEKYKEALGRLR